MRASEFVTHLQQMIAEHGDFPLALVERVEDNDSVVFIEIGNIDCVLSLSDEDILLDENDEHSYEKTIFLID